VAHNFDLSLNLQFFKGILVGLWGIIQFLVYMKVCICIKSITIFLHLEVSCLTNPIIHFLHASNNHSVSGLFRQEGEVRPVSRAVTPDHVPVCMSFDLSVQVA
jgi:hypothetical protein